MSNKAFQQNLDDKKGPQPGGPYLIQMLFKEPVEMPDKEKMTAVMEKHIGSTECFCYDKKMAGFAAQEHIAEFKDGKCPVQLMVMKCDKFKGKGFDAFLMSQMWDCQEDRERIFRECKYQVVATDMLAAALPALERANLDADFLEALAELYPTCEAFYFQSCGKLFLAEAVRSHQIEGSDRFIRFGVNVRFFNIEGTEDMLIDTVGMSTLFLPDLQYHFHDMNPNWVVNHAYNVASYILEHIFVNKELQRVTRGALDDLSDKGVIKKFPPCIASTHTALVLKEPKTKTSIRRVYLPKTVAYMLVERKKEIDELMDLFGDEYIDNNLVFCSSNGRPMESQVINRAFNKLIKENGLPHVVFHSLRHSSITYKLKLNGGDMKSVQGDSGHAQVKMVADVYSHIIDEDRCINAQRLEKAFYSSKTPDPVEDTEPETADTAVTESDESDAVKILELLKNPETAALLKQLAKAL